MFSYPYGTIDNVFLFSPAQLLQLKPIMKRFCIRSEHEFEKSFEQMMSFRYNQVEAYTYCVSNLNSSPIPISALHSYRTSWLAQRKGFHLHRVYFFLDKISHLITQMKQTVPDQEILSLQSKKMPYYNDFGFLVKVEKEHCLLSHQCSDHTIEFPVHKSLFKNMRKFDKYVKKLVIEILRAQLLLSVNLHCTMSEKPQLSINLGDSMLYISNRKICTEMTKLRQHITLCSTEVSHPQANAFLLKAIKHCEAKEIFHKQNIATHLLSQLFTWQPLKPELSCVETQTKELTRCTDKFSKQLTLPKDTWSLFKNDKEKLALHLTPT